MPEPLPSLKAAIVGASGYTGAELIASLLRHRYAKIEGLFGSDKAAAEPSIAKLHPRFRGQLDLTVKPASAESIAACEAKLAFLATPHELSHELAPELLERGLTVIDLSGAYRSPEPDFYTTNYGFIHKHPSLAKRAAYGQPELFGDKLPGARLIANPGCYPTSILLPLKPLIDAKQLNADWGLVADSISGVSGAGRAAKADLHFSEVSVKAYGIPHHRHRPEIETWLGAKIAFVPHIAPFDRGMLSTIHAKVAAGVGEEALRKTLRARYERSPFVRLLAPGEWPTVRDVAGTNFCDIALSLDAASGHLVMVSAIDNLLKGASGQAIQNMNRVFGFPETEGLLP